jgi:hypothetical protein
MSFKNFFLIFGICLVMGCSDYIKGHKKEDEVLKFSNDRFACLNKVPESLRNMVTDHSRPEKIEETLICLENSLSYFKKRTKGNVPDGYSIQDIRAFFGNYLGDRDRVSDEMAAQMMKVKKALFGGSEMIITKTELQGLIDLLVSIRDEIQPLKPYWDVILIKNGLKPDKNIISRGHQALTEGLTRLVLKTNLVRSEYTFADFKSLMNEAEKFVRRAPGKSSVEFMKWIPLMESVKIHLFSDHADMSSAAKWKEAVAMVMELHHMFSLYVYHYKGFDFYSHEAFQTGDEMILSAIQLLDKSWWMDKDGIPFSYTEKLFKNLEELQLLPKNTTSESFFDTYQTIVKNLLDRDTENKAVTLKTLARKHIATLKSEYRGFKAVQNFNDSMPEQFSYTQLIKKLEQTPSVQVEAFPEISDEFLNLSWRDWNTHLKQTHPMLYLKTGELLLDRKAKSSEEWSWFALTHLNVMKFLNRVLMLSFGTQHSMDLAHETLNEDSMKRFYAEFWNLGVQLKAFDPRSGNSGKRTYFEADHFVYSSNGDKKVTLQESFELVNIIFSAGISGLNQIQKDLSHSSCILPEIDFFGNNWLDEECFKGILRKNFSNYFKNLTGLKDWVSGLSDSEWDSFYKELIDFSRANPNTVGKIETGDLRAMVVITHYIESMYIKMDSNEDDKLSIEELINGSSRFIPFFKELFKLQPKGPFLRETQEYLIDYTIARAFACMVITGEMPKMTSCTPAFFKDAVKMKPYSNRALILRTLNAFKSSIK